LLSNLIDLVLQLNVLVVYLLNTLLNALGSSLLLVKLVLEVFHYLVVEADASIREGLRHRRLLQRGVVARV